MEIIPIGSQELSVPLPDYGYAACLGFEFESSQGSGSNSEDFSAAAIVSRLDHICVADSSNDNNSNNSEDVCDDASELIDDDCEECRAGRPHHASKGACDEHDVSMYFSDVFKPADLSLYNELDEDDETSRKRLRCDEEIDAILFDINDPLEDIHLRKVRRSDDRYETSCALSGEARESSRKDEAWDLPIVTSAPLSCETTIPNEMMGNEELHTQSPVDWEYGTGRSADAATTIGEMAMSSSVSDTHAAFSDRTGQPCWRDAVPLSLESMLITDISMFRVPRLNGDDRRSAKGALDGPLASEVHAAASQLLHTSPADSARGCRAGRSKKAAVANKARARPSKSESAKTSPARFQRACEIARRATDKQRSEEQGSAMDTAADAPAHRHDDCRTSRMRTCHAMKGVTDVAASSVVPGHVETSNELPGISAVPGTPESSDEHTHEMDADAAREEEIIVSRREWREGAVRLHVSCAAVLGTRRPANEEVGERPAPDWTSLDVVHHRPTIVSELMSVPECTQDVNIDAVLLVDSLGVYLELTDRFVRKELFVLAGLSCGQEAMIRISLRRAKMRTAKR
eukprot:Opistho-2@46932